MPSMSADPRHLEWHYPAPSRCRRAVVLASRPWISTRCRPFAVREAIFWARLRLVGGVPADTASFFRQTPAIFSRLWLCRLPRSAGDPHLLPVRAVPAGPAAGRATDAWNAAPSSSAAASRRSADPLGRAQPYNDIRICGIFDDRDDDRSPLASPAIRSSARISELIAFARITRIDMVIVSLPLTAETRVLQMLKKLWVLPVDIRLSAHSNELQFRPRSYSYIGSVPMLDMFDKPINDWDSCRNGLRQVRRQSASGRRFADHADRCASPSSSTARDRCFSQKRHGFNNEVIEVYKFRSMYVEQCDPTASRRSRRTTRASPASAASSARPRSTNCRSFSTRVRRAVAGRAAPARHSGQGRQPALQRGGRRLFRPPPRQARHHRLGADQWLARRDRYPREDPQRVEHDLYYIENWSLLFDLYIVAKTPLVLARGGNAY